MQESIRNEFEKDHWGFLAEEYEILHKAKQEKKEVKP